jgi:hypothetical protein
MNTRMSMAVTIGLAFLLAGPTGAAAQGSAASGSEARAVVERMLEGMGGADRLKAIRAVRVKSSGYEHHLEQSERPEGPWIVGYAQTTETRDFERGRLRHEEQARSFFYQSADWVPMNWVFADGVAAMLGPGGRTAPRDAFTAQQAEETLELGPERIGLTALAAADLHLERDIPYRDHAHAVAAFTWKGFPVRVLISRESGLLSAVELTRPRIESVFWGPWGDVTFRRSFALWMLEPGGVRLPRTTFTEWNGFALSSQTVDEIEFDPAVADADFAITPEVRQAFAARKVPADDMPLGGRGLVPVEPAPGITQIRGLWDVTLVKQADGIVILEGPISNGYSARILDEAAKRYPGVPVKAVITTSDAWPHIGGMREYVARGIPVFALDHNQAILERLFRAPRKIAPDALARTPKPARLTLVSKRLPIGTGENRIELIPLRTVTGERQMAIWFPEQKLLYSSDLFQRDPKGEFFLPQTLSEIVTVATREGLDPKTLFAMHLPPTPWSDITAAHARYIAPKVK